MNKKISIIVPVYNVEEYLNQCLDSLVNQTYQNLEIICINDGSADGSLEILKSYAQNDQRIMVINQENTGVAEARNRAIKVATGQFMMFADGDDWLELDACETLINIMDKECPDVIMYSYYREYENKTLTKDNIFSEDYIVFEEKECRNLHRRHAGIIGDELRHPENADAICSLCTKMFVTKYIQDNDIKYIDNKIVGTNGDGLFNLFYYEYIKKAVFVNKHLYHYRKTNQNSIVTAYKKNFPERWNNMFDIIERYINDKSLSNDFTEGLDNRISLSIIGLGLNELSSKKSLYLKYKEIKRILNSERYRKCVKKLQIAKMPIHWKVFFCASKHNIVIIVFGMLLAITKLKKVI